MKKDTRSAAEITSSAKSNLAFALACLPKERRQDLVVFYAFCRIIDDIADDEGYTTEQRVEGLQYWKDGFNNGFDNNHEVENQILAVRDKYQIPTDLFLDLITGCEMDLTPQTYATWNDLQGYTYRVACVVGLISLYIFGADPERSHQYALKLGHALQLTNILRDISEDLDNGGRIYLPIEDLAQFGYSPKDLLAKIYDIRFRDMMQFQVERAKALYEEAEAALPDEDKHALKAARIMGDIYYELIKKIEKQNYQIFNRRLSVSKAKKVFFLIKGML